MNRYSFAIKCDYNNQFIQFDSLKLIKIKII